MPTRPEFSVLIPTLEEAQWLGHCLGTVRASLAYGDVSGEIVVCDGGSRDGTLEIARRTPGVRVVSGPPGRARQLRRGVERARADTLVFLHADALVRPEWARAIQDAFGDGVDAGWCEVEILPEEASTPTSNALPVVARAMNWRTRRFRTATGDQSLFVRRDCLEAVGGLPDVPIMEGAELAAALRDRGEVRVLGPLVRISGRRWERTGLLRAALSMHAVRAGYMLGVDPDRLHRVWRWATGDG